ANLPAWIAPTAAMTFYAAALAVTICALGSLLGLSPPSSVAAAWIGLLLALPFDFFWGTDRHYVCRAQHGSERLACVRAYVLAMLLLVNNGWKGPRIAYIDIFAYPF